MEPTNRLDGITTNNKEIPTTNPQLFSTFKIQQSKYIQQKQQIVIPLKRKIRTLEEFLRFNKSATLLKSKSKTDKPNQKENENKNKHKTKNKKKEHKSTNNSKSIANKNSECGNIFDISKHADGNTSSTTTRILAKDLSPEFHDSLFKSILGKSKSGRWKNIYGINIVHEEAMSLFPRQMLHDTIMEAMFSLVCHQSTHDPDMITSMTLRIGPLATYFLNPTFENRQDLRLQLTTGVGPGSVLVIVPICLHSSQHWNVAVADKRKKTIQTFDPYQPSRKIGQFFDKRNNIQDDLHPHYYSSSSSSSTTIGGLGQSELELGRYLKLFKELLEISFNEKGMWCNKGAVSTTQNEDQDQESNKQEVLEEGIVHGYYYEQYNYWPWNANFIQLENYIFPQKGAINCGILAIAFMELTTERPQFYCEDNFFNLFNIDSGYLRLRYFTELLEHEDI